jgi:hypothetical protein
VLQRANDLRYEQLATEVNDLRIQLMTMKLSQYQDKVMAKTLGKRDYNEI